MIHRDVKIFVNVNEVSRSRKCNKPILASYSRGKRMKNKNVLRMPIAPMASKTTRIVIIIQKSLDDMAVNLLEEQ